MTPISGAPGVYTYAVPPTFVAGAVAGRRVIVPFGSARRTAVVLGPGVDDGVRTIKEIDALLDDGPLLSGELIDLSRWAADYYLAPLSLALKAALPPGSEVEESRTPVLGAAGKAALAATNTPVATRKALRAIQLGESQLLREGTLRRLVKEGLVELVREAQAGGNAPMVEMLEAVATDEPPAFTKAQKRQQALYELLTARGRVAMRELAAEQPTHRETAKRLEKRGLARFSEEPESHATGAGTETPPALTEEQAAALEVLLKALGEAKPKPVLLEGVTGSGKTEVYLRLIEQATRGGGTALVLVPEIALTPQLARRFRARFGPAVAVLHSGLGERERLSEWHRIRRGGARVVVGARSAVFAPLDRPKVVIVDEEHDGSFKQDGGLRYHGRDLAIVRANAAGALVVLGSATPSLETVWNVARGRYERLRLTMRVDTRPMPEVQLIDLRGRAKVKAEAGILPSGLLSPELVTALQETHAKGEQAIVFLNRRGHSTALLCRDCGWVAKCSNCSVSYTWHERRKRLVCHYCGVREEDPRECPTCQGTRLLLTGAGTEKLEDELAAVLPGAKVRRLDRDAVSTSARLEQVLGQFAAGEIDVLVGTQMVAKGHDFPGVTLVCVLLADAGLHQPDFRSGERTAQLLTQVAGRAGRGEKPGRVLVQTFSPEARAVAAVVGHDYASFAAHELEEREAVNYPPFCRLCLVRVEGGIL